MQLRALTVDDAQAFWALRLRGLRDEPGAFGYSYEETCLLPPDFAAAILRRDGRSPDDVVLGAFDGEALAGIVGLERDRRKKRSHRATLWGMYVLPDARGRGAARRLAEALIERARAIPGLTRLNLTVMADNEAAVRLYRSLGFEPWGLERQAMLLLGVAHDEVSMALEL